jgi:uncharacterized membrane protein YcfT
MAATAQISPRAMDFGRLVLRIDGLVCMVAGTAALVGCRALSDFLGVDGTVPLAVIGAGTLACGVWIARQIRVAVPRGLVLACAIVNAIWVVASAAMLLLGTPAFSTRGIVLIEAVADVVALLAIAQFVAYRRMADA